MRFFLFLATLGVLFAGTAWGAQTAHKCMILEPENYNTDCRLTTDDRVQRLPISKTAIGEITAGSCLDSWTSAVDFAYAWESIQTGKVAGRCIKRPTLFIDALTGVGGKDTLEGWVTAPAGEAPNNPCAITYNGATAIVYKYTCYTEYGL